MANSGRLTPYPSAFRECIACDDGTVMTPIGADRWRCPECRAELYLPSRGKPAAEGRKDLETRVDMTENRGLKTKKAGSLATVGLPRHSVDPRIVTPGARADSRSDQDSTT